MFRPATMKEESQAGATTARRGVRTNAQSSMSPVRERLSPASSRRRSPGAGVIRVSPESEPEGLNALSEGFKEAPERG